MEEESRSAERRKVVFTVVAEQGPGAGAEEVMGMEIEEEVGGSEQSPEAC